MQSVGGEYQVEYKHCPRSQTARISLIHDLELDLWPWPTHMQKIKVKGQSVQKIACIQTNERTDGRTEAIALPDPPVWSVMNWRMSKRKINHWLTPLLTLTDEFVSITAGSRFPLVISKDNTLLFWKLSSVWLTLLLLPVAVLCI